MRRIVKLGFVVEVVSAPGQKDVALVETSRAGRCLFTQTKMPLAVSKEYAECPWMRRLTTCQT